MNSEWKNFHKRHSALVLYVTIAIMCLLLYCSWSVGCGEVYNNIIATNGLATFLLVHPEQRGMVVRACPLLGVIILSGCTNVSFIVKRCLICAHTGGVLNCYL